MPQLPQGLQINTFLQPLPPNDQFEGILHSMYLKGGFQEVNSIAERNAIPIWGNDPGVVYNGFGLGDDGGWTSGRRKVGMLVFVLETKKLYSLIPVGYFGNKGNGDEAAWLGLSQVEKAVRMFPTGTYTSALGSPPNFINTYVDASTYGIDVDDNGNALTTLELDNSCWVEFEVGGGNTYNSSIANTDIEMVADVGGIVQGTSVGDLTGIFSYDDLFDALLFPTSNPVISPYHSVGLSNSVGSLAIIGSEHNIILNTTANKGLIKLDGATQGPYTGAVTGATMSGPTFSGVASLGVGPGDTDISNPEATSHIIVLGTAGNKWTSVTTFNTGPQPQDSAGNNYNAIRFMGGDKTTSTQIEGVYPIFLGNASNTFDQRSLISHGANNIQCDQTYGETNGSLHHRISVPNEMVAGRTIQVWQYSSVSNSYSEATGAWVIDNTETRTIENDTVGYTLLSKTGSAGGGNLYRIKFV